MITNLPHAPIGVPLIIIRITDQDFAARLSRLGLYEGTRITRQDETIAIGPVKVRGPKGEAVLSGWSAGHIIMHLDDDRRLPLLECAPGNSGHVEGLTGHEMVEKALLKLGVAEDDQITFLRRMPPMTYKVLVEGTHHEQLNEGLAAKLLGDTPTGPAQFCSVGVGENFTVRHILGGKTSTDILTAMHIEPGTNLSLQSVSSTQILNFSEKKPIVCTTADGLRLYFKEKDAGDLIVSGEI